MSYRQLAKQSTHFLVKYHEDGKLQVRSRGFFRNKEEIEVGKSYEVQWGRAKEISTADVLYSGTEGEMKEKQSMCHAASASSHRQLSKSKPPVKRKQPQPKDGNNKAKIIRVVSPKQHVSREEGQKQPSSFSDADAPTTATSPSPVSKETPQSPPHSTSTTNNVTPQPEVTEQQDITANPTTPTLQSRSFTFPPTIQTSLAVADVHVSPSESQTPGLTLQRPAATTLTPIRTARSSTSVPSMSQVMSAINILATNVKDLTRTLDNCTKSLAMQTKRIQELEVSSTRIERKLDEALSVRSSNSHSINNITSDQATIEDIPQELAIDRARLKALKHEANSAGHFACLLLPEVFPELFGPGNLRTAYNRGGNRHTGKQELDKTKKNVIEKYTKFMFPESVKSWQPVVNTINERLRRKDKLSKKNVMTDICNMQPVSVDEDNIPESESVRRETYDLDMRNIENMDPAEAANPDFNMSFLRVLYEGKERLMQGCEVVHATYFGSPANVNNSNNSRIYITYRRAAENAPSDMLAVVDLCVILENKGESPPHSYNQIQKNLNKGLVGSDVYLCYKKAMTKTDILAYKPAILDRYPKEDYENFPLPESVAMFCLPMGATVECWSAKAQHPFPVFSTFILTGIGWNKLYGAAITFYEEFPEDKLTDLQMRHLGLKNKHIRQQYRMMKTVHSNKCICLLSHWPFFDAFKKILSYLYRISITGPHTVPIERHISHFMYDVPYPSPKRPRILVQLSHDSISLSMPEDSPLPQSGASFVTMLKNLSPENCMTILLYVLHEYKILIHSLRPAVLTSVAEAVSTLIFPLQWQCPYIPLCPLGLSDVLNAPTPYIIGLDSRYFDLFDPPPDVICIDLDTVRIWPPDDKKQISYKLLPKKPTKILQETLHNLFDRLAKEMPRQNHDEVTLDMAPIDLDFKRKQKEMMLELQIQEAFLRFMACIMKGYKQFLRPIENAPDLDTTNAAHLFDMNGFLKTRDKANHKFFQTLLRTQLFNRFIEERSFVSDKDVSLAFFDECTEKVDENKDEPKLIELDDSSKSERTMFILPPEPVGLPEGVSYSYNGFPKLNAELFLEREQPVKSNIGKKVTTGSGSPVVRRTKQEIKTAQKAAQQYLSQPSLWAKCLLSQSFSLWFMVLPAYVKQCQSVTKALNVAYDVLKTMQKQNLKSLDELCYRVVLQLCGQYSQPVLAVKVYSEMKHAGVQPNAITYGYYNKAVLEGKWPSSISKGRKLWRKLRNVVIGVAKFRKAVRRRSLSVNSNSGSEFDQTSIDSFLEDQFTDGKQETIIRGETADVAHGSMVINRGKIPEESESAGTASDRGYNSMTQEEAKEISEIIGSENKDVGSVESKLKKDIKNVLRFSFRRKQKKKESQIQEESLTAEFEEPKTGVSGDDLFSGTGSGKGLSQFTKQVQSIVRQRSVSGSSNPDTFYHHGSLYGPSVGIIIVSESLQNGSLSQSMGPTYGRNVRKEDRRKRHKSAGDHSKPRSNSLLNNFKVRSSGGDEMENEFSELLERESSQGIVDGSEGQTNDSTDIQEISRDIKDSGVALDDNEVDGDYMCESPCEPLEQCKNHTDGDKPADIDVSGNKNISDESSEVTGQNGIDSLSVLSGAGVGEKTNRSGSLKSTKSSPQHSIATPVTDKDPLGLFVDSKIAKPEGAKTVSPKHSPQKVREKLMEAKPFQREMKPKPGKLDLGKCNMIESIGSDESQNTENVIHSGPLSPVEKVQRSSKIERTSSFPENLGNPQKGTNSWRAKRERSDSHTETVSLGRSNTSLNEPKSESTAVTPKNDFRLFRTGSFRRHKESFSGMLKYATGAVATKLTEIKQSMTPSKLGSSTSSLTHSIDEVESDNESSKESYRKKGSIDFLTRSQDKLDNSSLNGGQESAPTHPSFMDQMDTLCQEQWANFQQTHITVIDPKNIAIEVEICSCCRCPRCKCLIYDEEIMAGWNADDSNLNTSCQFCSTKLVPHLMIYLKDNREKTKSNLTDTNPEDKASDPAKNEFSPKSDKSYGKDSDICGPTSNGDSELLFGEDLDDTSSLRSFESSQDPWMRQSGQADTVDGLNGGQDRQGRDSPTLADLAALGRHRRTASECLTSATEFMYSSSIDSVDSLSFRNMRSPPSISMDESGSLPAKSSLSPVTKRALFDMNSKADQVSVPYLSPIVLRKNLESIIESEGNSSLATDTFVDEHPIIYWNLIWYFRRIQVTSHLQGFLLTTRSYNLNTEASKNEKFTSDNVVIRPKWDNVRIHEEIGQPMHVAYSKGQGSTTVDALLTESQPFNRPFMHQIIDNITCNDVLSPIKKIMNGRRRFRRKQFRSLYREVLFLSFTALGRENIDHDAFDREYNHAYEHLTAGEKKRLQRDEKPRLPAVQACRKVFCDLEI